MTDIELLLEESAQRFSDAANNQQSKIKNLEVELAKLHKVQNSLIAELERAEVLGDKVGREKAASDIDIVGAKIIGVEKAIADLDITALAQGLWTECESYKHSLENQFQSRWAKAQELKEALLEELRQLGGIKRVSEIVAYRANQVSIQLNRQPMNPIKSGVVHNQTFEIPFTLVTKLVRS
jgi:hypothetical protein